MVMYAPRLTEFVDEVTEYEPGRRVGHRSVSDSLVIFTACHADPVPGGTRATLVFEPERLPGGKFGKLSAPFIARTVRRKYRADLARLKQILEGGGRSLTSRILYKMAAVALVLSAALTLSGFAAHPSVEPDQMVTTAWRVSHLVLWAGGAFGLLGVAGLYLRHRADVGVVGTSGAALAALCLLALGGAYYSEAVIIPVLGVEAPVLMGTFPAGDAWIAYRMAVAISSLATGLGVVLLGVGLLRTRLHRWAIAAAGVGALGAGIGFALPRPVSLGAVSLLAGGLVGFGFGLWKSAHASESRSALT